MSDWMTDLMPLLKKSGVSGDAFMVYAVLRQSETLVPNGMASFVDSALLPLTSDQITAALNNLMFVGWIVDLIDTDDGKQAILGRPDQRLKHRIVYALDEWIADQEVTVTPTIHPQSIAVSPDASDRMLRLSKSVQSGNKIFEEGAAKRASKLAVSSKRRSEQVLESGSWASTGPQKEKAKTVSDVAIDYIRLLSKNGISIPPPMIEMKKVTAAFKVWTGEYGIDHVLSVLNEVLPLWSEIQTRFRYTGLPSPQNLLGMRHQISVMKDGSVMAHIRDVKSSYKKSDKKSSMGRDEWNGNDKKPADDDTGW